MRYIIYLKDIYNTNYQVWLDTDDDIENEIELEVSDKTPLVIELEGGEDNLFTPVLYAGGTLNITNNSYLEDLYSENYKTKFTLYNYDDDYIVFMGYITPELYTQDYVKPYEEVEINFVDGLSYLKNVDYTTIADGRREYRTVLNVLYNIFKCSGIQYNYMYIPYNLVLDPQDIESTSAFVDSAVTNILADCKINEANFFDEDDKPMKCSEVLEEICKYFGLTCFVQNQTIWFINYNNICNERGNYYRYDLRYGYNSFISQETKRNFNCVPIELNKQSVASDHTNLSLGEVYNKIRVIDDFYFKDELMPDLFDDKAEEVTPVVPFEERLWLVSEGGNTFGGQWILTKYYKHPCLSVANNGANTAKTWFEFGSNQAYGAYYHTALIKQQCHETTATSLSDPDTLFVSSVNDKFLCVHKGGSSFGATDERCTIYSYEDNLYKAGEYILINFDLRVNGYVNAYAATNGVVNQSLQPIKGYANISSQQLDPIAFNELNMKLKVGNKYWTGSAWVTSETTFSLPLMVEHKAARPTSNVHYYENISEEGFKIPLENYMSGYIELTIYAPNFQSPIGIYEPALFFRDFSIKVLNTSIYNELKERGEETIYDDVACYTALDDFEDIELKINTWDDKNPNISSVCLGARASDRPSRYVDTLFNVNDSLEMRAEQHLVRYYVAEYKQPQLYITSDLIYLPDMCRSYILNFAQIDNTHRFIINKYSWDIKNSTYSLGFKEIFNTSTSTTNKLYRDKQYNRNNTIAFKTSNSET